MERVCFTGLRASVERAIAGRSGPSRSRSRNSTTEAAAVRWVASLRASWRPPAIVTSSAAGSPAYQPRAAASGLIDVVGAVQAEHRHPHARGDGAAREPLPRQPLVPARRGAVRRRRRGGPGGWGTRCGPRPRPPSLRPLRRRVGRDPGEHQPGHPARPPATSPAANRAPASEPTSTRAAAGPSASAARGSAPPCGPRRRSGRRRPTPGSRRRRSGGRTARRPRRARPGRGRRRACPAGRRRRARVQERTVRHCSRDRSRETTFLVSARSSGELRAQLGAFGAAHARRRPRWAPSRGAAACTGARERR